jgi:PTH1 family peptidyl-tRNA hydrolase
VAADLLAVGIGNPGADYRGSRHNLGVEVIELLATRHGGKLTLSKKERSLIDVVNVSGRRLALAFPQTFMNNSGEAVAPLMRRYDIDDPSKLIVVHDELDLEPGRLKVKVGGGLAGHNGLRSIKSHLHSGEFVRVRIGVGKPPGGKERGADHVLNRISKRMREEFDIVVQEAADAVEMIVTDGPDRAMERYNQRPGEPETD